LLELYLRVLLRLPLQVLLKRRAALHAGPTCSALPEISVGKFKIGETLAATDGSL